VRRSKNAKATRNVFSLDARLSPPRPRAGPLRAEHGRLGETAARLARGEWGQPSFRLQMLCG